MRRATWWIDDDLRDLATEAARSQGQMSVSAWVRWTLRATAERQIREARERREDTMRRVIGTVEGVDILEHDGVTEWADCAECGAHLDPVSDASTPGREWDGSCYLCGAASERVGMRRECAAQIAG